ncbi:MAG: hypothetical protein PWQ85_1416 [Geotoga sp.]|nr:hypothetical protein [Geotoga sp.]
MDKPKFVGGQAVIEGIMMKGIHTVVAVKTKEGKIAIKKLKDKSWGFIEKIPLIRGFFVLLHAMITGMTALSYSAKMSGEEDEEITNKDMVFAILIAVVVAAGGFGVLPVLIAKPFNIQSEFWFAVLEGVVRAVLVVGYIYVIMWNKFYIADSFCVNSGILNIRWIRLEFYVGKDYLKSCSSPIGSWPCL